MAHIRKPTYTKPLPADAVLFDKNGETWARWTSKRGKPRTAPVARTVNGKPVPADAALFEQDGAPWASWTDKHQQTHKGPITLRLRFESKKYSVTYKDHNGQVRSHKGFTDRGAAKTRASDLERQVERNSVGLVDPFEEQRKRPLSEHLADFRQHLEAKGDDPRHVRQTIAHVEAMLAGCGFSWLGDLELTRAQEWLTGLRTGKRVELPAGQVEFTIRKTAELLGVKPDSVSPLIKRRNLPTNGRDGKARRLPRSTVETLLADRCQGASPETVNHYTRAVRSFARWLVKPGRRVASNPLDGLEVLNADADRRRSRRELMVEELLRLLTATMDSQSSFLGLDGWQRFHLYACACGTGFRASGLASLTPECFDLADDYPTLTLPVRGDKSRKGKRQPLPADVAALMRSWLVGKPEGLPLWPGTWASARRAAEMLRRDLAAAGIPHLVQGPDGPLVIDFHAMRHTYLTLGGRAGIDLRTLQELAGHSKSSLTERYTHVRLHDLAGAVEKLPSFLPDVSGSQHQQMRATGTEGYPVVLPLLPAGTPQVQQRQSGTIRFCESFSQANPESASGTAGGARESQTVDLDVAGSNPVTHPETTVRNRFSSRSLLYVRRMLARRQALG
jgi:integrase